LNIPQKARIEGRGRWQQGHGGWRRTAAPTGTGQSAVGRGEREEDEGIEWEMSKEEAKEINIKGREECQLREETKVVFQQQQQQQHLPV